MKYALFLGCNIPARVPEYEMSARVVLERLGVQPVDITTGTVEKGFNCCGYPLRNTDAKAYLVLAARNLALAESESLDIMTLCKCCFGSLKHAAHILDEQPRLRTDVNRELNKEGLSYRGSVKVRHMLSVIYHDVGVDNVKLRIKKPFKNLNIATHYGCHALRPSRVTQFDNPVSPSLFDQLVEVTGAKSIDWAKKLECCGAPVLGINDSLSMDLTREKVRDGIRSGADYLCTACPYCQMQFETIQKSVAERFEESRYLAPILYPQLLGISMGIDGDRLGLKIDMGEHK